MNCIRKRLHKSSLGGNGIISTPAAASTNVDYRKRALPYLVIETVYAEEACVYNIVIRKEVVDNQTALSRASPNLGM